MALSFGSFAFVGLDNKTDRFTSMRPVLSNGAVFSLHATLRRGLLACHSCDFAPSQWISSPWRMTAHITCHIMVDPVMLTGASLLASYNLCATGKKLPGRDGTVSFSDSRVLGGIPGVSVRMFEHIAQPPGRAPIGARHHLAAVSSRTAWLGNGGMMMPRKDRTPHLSDLVRGDKRWEMGDGKRALVPLSVSSSSLLPFNFTSLVPPPALNQKHIAWDQQATWTRVARVSPSNFQMVPRLPQ